MTKPWTIETWALPSPEKLQTSPNNIDKNHRATLWQIGNHNVPNQFSFTLRKESPNCIQAMLYDGARSTSQQLCLSAGYTPNVPIYTAVTYDGNGDYKLYLGSTTFISTATFNFTNHYQPADKFWIGSYDLPKGAWGGTILDMRISDTVRSDQELRTNWTNRWPIAVDSKTICKLSFDGTLEAESSADLE